MSFYHDQLTFHLAGLCPLGLSLKREKCLRFANNRRSWTCAVQLIIKQMQAQPLKSLLISFYFSITCRPYHRQPSVLGMQTRWLKRLIPSRQWMLSGSRGYSNHIISPIGNCFDNPRHPPQAQQARPKREITRSNRLCAIKLPLIRNPAETVIVESS